LGFFNSPTGPRVVDGVLRGNHPSILGLARERSAKMSLLSFFDRPDDYSKMLGRMAVITGILAFISSAFLSHALSEKGVALPSPKMLAEQEITAFGFTRSFWSLLPAILIAWLFRRVKMHDRVSDFLKIREGFDTHVILSRLAGEVGVPVDLHALSVFRQRRHDLIYPVFYEYVDAHNPKISKHHVVKALDAWFGYWVAIEAVLILAPVGVVLLLLGSYLFAAVFLGLALFCTLISLNYFRTCAPLAEREIDAMTKHADWPLWKVAIRGHFDNALSG